MTYKIITNQYGEKSLLQNNTAFMNANIIVDKYSYPSVNIIGKIKIPIRTNKPGNKKTYL